MYSRLRNKKELTNTFMVFLLIACSGIPYFVGSYFIMPLSFAYVLLICHKRRIIILDKSLLVILFLLISKAIARELLYGFNPSVYENLVLVLKYSFPFLLLKITRIKFIDYYINVMYYIALSSLFFFVLFSISPSLMSFFKTTVSPYFYIDSKTEFYTYAPNFIIYLFSVEGRNAGPFWEPGGFGVFLIIAIVFNLFKTKSFFNKHGIILLIATITTFSTATYVALFMSFFGFVFSLRDTRYRIFIAPLALFITFYTYQEAEFLSTKVDQHLSVIDTNYEARVANRFTSILIDLNRIGDHPVLGNPKGGRGEYTIFHHRNNGLSSMAVSHGLIYTFLFFFLMYKSFKKILKHYANYNILMLNFATASVMAIYFGQVLTDKPLLNALFMWPFIIHGKQNE